MFDVGDRVRLSKKQKAFDKSYLPQRTEEVFLVNQVIPIRLQNRTGLLLKVVFTYKNYRKSMWTIKYFGSKKGLQLGVTVHKFMLISICQCLCHIMVS